MNNILRKLIYIIGIICLISCSQEDDYMDHVDKFSISYDVYPQTSLDIYTPKNNEKNRPVLIYIHGGGWYSGDKSEWDASKIETFCRKGYICVSVNYRLSPEVSHPVHIQDVSNAVNWCEDNIAFYGGDSTNIVLVGHSAGAHLVALAVTNQKYFKNSGVNICHIKTAYILDAGAYLIMDSLVYDDKDILSLIYNAVGTNMHSQKWEDFAPYNFIGPEKYIPYLIIAHSDVTYRCNANKKFCVKLKECRKNYKEYILRGYSHAEVLVKFPSYIDADIIN